MQLGRAKRHNHIKSTRSQFDTGGTTLERHVIVIAPCNQVNPPGFLKVAPSLRDNDRSPVSHVIDIGVFPDSTAHGGSKQVP